MKTDTHSLSYLDRLFLESEMFRMEGVEKIKTHSLCSITLFFENRALCETMRKIIEELGKP